MKQTTLYNRFKKLSLPATSVSARIIRYLCGERTYTTMGYVDDKKIFRPCYAAGRGRYIHNVDHTSEVCALLDRLGVKYEKGNDAPRGGLTGNYIRIITKIVEG